MEFIGKKDMTIELKCSEKEPGISGVDITNGFRYIDAVEKAVREGIMLADKAERRSILNAYVFALRITARAIEGIRTELEKEGAL